MNRRYLILAAIAGFIVTLDQMTKMYIHTQFSLGESHTIIQNFFDLTYVRNTGAAFGVFRDSNAIFRSIFFLSIPPIAMTLILFMLKSVPDKDSIQILALSGIFGGALGNYVDRLRLGYVVDFLSFHWKDFYTFPAFNVADSSIVIGVFSLFILMSLDARDDLKTKKTKSVETVARVKNKMAES